MQKQVDAERVQFGQETNEVLQAATESVHRPRHDHIEFALGSIPNKPVKLWPLITALGTADVAMMQSRQDWRRDSKRVTRKLTSSGMLAARIIVLLQGRSRRSHLGSITSL
jgi:hypothetical protein